MILRRRPVSRIQIGALPWREGVHGREVMLITTRGRRQWLTPKGKPIAGLTAAEAAAQEAWEEAGVRGVIAASPIGSFEHRKGAFLTARRLQVELFPLEVTFEAEDWPEAHQRERRWVSIPTALRLVRSPGLLTLIEAFGALPATRRVRMMRALRRLAAFARRR